MERLWIGEEMNLGCRQSYSIFEGLKLRTRHDKRGNSAYVYSSPYGVTYYISDEDLMNKIQEYSEEGEVGYLKIKEAIYEESIRRYGIGKFLLTIEAKIENEKKRSYAEGKEDLQGDLRLLLGLNRQD